MPSLISSTSDNISLAHAVEVRFLDLCQMYSRTHGVELPIPSDLNRDMYRWRQMRVRHKQGDFRHTEAELRSVRTIAQWTLDAKRELCGKPTEQLQWE